VVFEPTAIQSVEKALAEIQMLNGDIHALIHVAADDARKQAESLDQSKVQLGPLFGTTFSAKDLIDVELQPTQAGSRLFGNQPVRQDASCVALLKAAGAIVLGKTNMHELAVGGAVNPWFGQVINPRSRTNGTGGTSSGSAAAVAAGLCDFALGTDTGGSNRSVAAATGLFGYKPSTGLIAMDGVLPIARSMDTVGVIAPSAEMISNCLQALTGEAAAEQNISLEGRTFARMTNLVTSPIDGVVAETLDIAFASVTACGGHIVTLDVKVPDALARAGVAIFRYEFAQTYAEKIDQSADSVGPAVHAFLAASRQISFTQYNDAMSLRLEHQAIWSKMLDAVDGFISPSSPGLAPDLDSESTKVGSALVAYGAAGAEFRMWANTIGIPAIAIPVQRACGLPSSVQLAGAKNSDRLLLDLAAALGRAMTEKRAD
jgi:Asp-tRNA(Asn)/Glu-tRNA(Gln) amidotransferase A subunit family amidase